MNNKIYKTWAATEDQAVGRFDEANIICIEALFQEFEPWSRGKGRGYKFWDYEILFDDETTIPAQRSNYQEEINLDNFIGKRVRMQANVFYGVLVGDPDDPESQQLTGYRIDIHQIESI